MGVSNIGSLSSMDVRSIPVQHTEHCGYKKQSSYGGANQTTDYRPAKGGILFAAFSHAHGHGNHTDDHGESRHQNRPKTREASFLSGAHGIAYGLQMLFRKANHQNAIGCSHAHAHDGSH